MLLSIVQMTGILDCIRTAHYLHCKKKEREREEEKANESMSVEVKSINSIFDCAFLDLKLISMEI